MKRKFPLLQQRDTMDCGPTCLAMICKYYGYKIGITEIRNMCGISREGVSLYGIYHAAQNIGFSATGTQVSLSDLRTIVTLPCILHWNQNHFVILCRIKNNKKETSYYIADPAGAIKLKYNQEELKKCWISDRTKDGDGLGTVLILRPSFPFPLKNEEKKKKIENSALTFLLPYIKLYKNKIGTLVGVLFLGSAIQLLLPFLTQSIVDIGISNKNIRYIVLILIGQLILETGVFITGFIRSWILLKIGSLINIQLISDYLVKLMALPLSFFDSKLTGDIMQRINDHSRIQSFLTAYSVDVTTQHPLRHE